MQKSRFLWEPGFFIGKKEQRWKISSAARK